MLDCDVDANPEPSIAWYKDVQTDGSGVPRLQVTTRSENELFLYQLILSDVRVSAAYSVNYFDDLSYNYVSVFIQFPITY